MDAITTEYYTKLGQEYDHYAALAEAARLEGQPVENSVAAFIANAIGEERARIIKESES